MNPLTSVDKAAVEESSARLGAMIGQQPAFEALREPTPDLGSLPEARWLSDVLGQRARAIEQHVDAWDRDFAQTTETMRQAASTMVGVDEDGASRVAGGRPPGDGDPGNAASPSGAGGPTDG